MKIVWSRNKTTHSLLGLIIIGLLVIIWSDHYQYKLLTQELVLTQSDLASTTATLFATKEELALKLTALDEARQKNNELTGNLQAEVERNNAIAGQVGSLANTVGTLQKLKETDPELLQKYSKVYFLNEHYVPAALVVIPPANLLLPEKQQLFHTKIWPRLDAMLTEAASANINLKILSAYRSFGDQADLKSGYKVIYGSGANKFSADQGYSEHQLGVTVDLTTTGVGSTLVDFDKTPAYAWLESNAYRYGFILSYPKNNDYYQFEPWHWRYVGLPLALKLHQENKHFYDLDQREIDQYLISFFD